MSDDAAKVEVLYAGGRVARYDDLNAAAAAIDAAAQRGAVALATDRRGARPVYLARVDGQWTRRAPAATPKRKARVAVKRPAYARPWRADIDG